ncbi:hypothetical protein AVEN_123832-1 [Araneus ventricosus]|uniref:Uncharacterized protein n=1 Tax=Araneus ventricosus TaxID=182803 RepID=A0A4Y1ZLB5_ARAVE|nr:hypothetical protein AVEN_123832-1 [Araneus ventricosus]
MELSSDLIITDQIKRKKTQEVKDHFIDGWSKLNSPDALVENLDDYDTLRSTFRSKQPQLGSTNLTKMDIKEVEGSKPECMKPYKTNAPERAAIKEIVRDEYENG